LKKEVIKLGFLYRLLIVCILLDIYHTITGKPMTDMEALTVLFILILDSILSKGDKNRDG